MLSRHLTHPRLVDIAEGESPGGRDGRHLERCARCRHDLDALTAARSAARDVPEVEPSPLFWARFPERVGQAFDEQKSRPRVAGLQRLPFPGGSRRRAVLVALGASGVAGVLLAAALWTDLVAPTPRPPQGPSVVARTAANTRPASGTLDALPADDPSWLVVVAGNDLDWDSAEASGLSVPPGSAERLATELTPDEQTELVRLLREEIAAGPS